MWSFGSPYIQVLLVDFVFPTPACRGRWLTVRVPPILRSSANQLRLRRGVRGDDVYHMYLLARQSSDCHRVHYFS